MSVSKTASTSSSGRHGSTCNRRFYTGNQLHHTAEDDISPIGSGHTEKDAFIHAGDDILSPPCLNWRPLELFLQRAHLGDLANDRLCSQSPKSCLIIDRSFSSSQSNIPAYPQVKQTLNPKDGNHSCLPQSTGTIFRKALNEQELYRWLLQKNSDSHTDRQVLFMANMTPLCALALATTVAGIFAAELKLFLQAHLLGEIHFFASMHSPDPPSWDTAQNHPHAELAFSLGFHLSYVALREGATLSDARGIRQSYSMIESIGDSADELFYYDAQISFLITGTDDGHWSAYCIIDNYMGSRESIEAYVTQNADGPSGGALKESQLCWSPREYFLLVLSKRIQQTTREWGNVTSTLMERLDAYESHYIRIIDSGDLRDNTDMALTRSYMKAVSILHQLHDTLSTQLESLQTFLDEEKQYFKNEDKISSGKWKYYLDRIWRDVVHLRKRQRRLMQRLKRFNGMKDGLIGSSSLLESRRSTKQGDNIRILTNMTVAYLPFNLAAGIFSISTVTPSGLVWLYWCVTSVLLGLVTFYFAFWGSLKDRWVRQGRPGGIARP